ncbi:MAG: acyl-ACP--UDP-N-acetylglucosamine O-acyltransferase [Chlamydiae bacterium]|nr:acyl-ACP--UDP-N-acetylglucosamine O-acyltransferase [Chlamydiota bacterium]
MGNIHPLAVVEDGAEIGTNVVVEPFAVVKKTVILKDNVTIKSHAYIDGFTTIGKGTVIYPGASIGTKPQDLKYKGEKTFVEIGENCEIREFATINSSCQENSVVKIGDNCLIMAYCHVAHNCIIGNRVIMANSAMLAGHVIIEDFVTVGGMTPVHQFCRIGKFAMVGGFSRVSHDIPPFTIGGGYPYRLGGLNLVGLKRHKLSLEIRRELAKAFKITYRMGNRLDEAIKQIKQEVEPIAEVKHWIEFIEQSKRGLIGFSNNYAESEDTKVQEHLEI